MSTNTGTPGFDIDGKTYTMDVGDPEAEASAGYPLVTDHGDIKVDNSVKDISKTTKKTLADYIGKKTQVNYYPVDSISSSPETKIAGDLSKNQTPPIPSPDQTTTNASYFTKGKNDISGETNSSTLRSWMSKGGQGDKKFVPVDSSVAKVNKGKSGNNEKDYKNGNELLPEIVGGDAGLPDPVKKYTSSVLNNNRFTSESTFGDGGDNPSLYSPKYGRFTTRRMAQVGISLSVRSSRELNSAASGQNPSSGGQEAKAILPSINQLGATKIDTAMLQAQDVLLNISDSEVPDSQLLSIGNESWGSLNNSLDTYSGITSFGMIALSTALTAGITLLIEGLGFLLAMIKVSPDPAKTPDGRFILGRSTMKKQSDPNAFPPGFPPDIGSLLGIRSTIHPFPSCLKKGTLAFFGIDDSDGLLAVSTGLASAASSPGYNSVVARSIIRSITVIIDSIKKIFGSSNLISGVKNLLSMIDVLRTSKLISSLNVFANLGDAVLCENHEEMITAPGEAMRKSRIDIASDDDEMMFVGKSRMGGKSDRKLKLAWSQNRAPSMYLLPSTTLALQSVATNLGSFQSGHSNDDKDTRAKYRLLSDSDTKINGNRIPIGKGSDASDELTVRNMERTLEAEYVPFYFHDIRTNEIISFHAFLASLGDDFSVSYESSEGFGRVEPVKIYKSTGRKIGLSFYIVATSVGDFNDMWVKINKLVTLVYPQYTEGRTLTDESGKYQFTQPFSQMISASPMIRIRLGNLLSTNYSRFALARLFGATLPGTKYGGTALSLNGDALKKVSGLIDSSRSSKGAKTWLVTPGFSYDVQTESGGITAAPGLSSGGKPSAREWAAGDESNYIPVKITDVNKDDTVVIETSAPDANFLNSQGITSTSRQQNIIKNINEKFANTKDPIHNIIKKKFRVKKSQLRASGETLKKIYNEAGVDSASIDDLTSFLDSEKNALVKSFKSTSGKGLAGFIDSLNFDWYDKVQWDTAPGNKAPMACKVTISFSPIHDISPGIDSQGYNRAPVYPVGYFKHSSDIDKG